MTPLDLTDEELEQLKKTALDPVLGDPNTTDPTPAPQPEAPMAPKPLVAPTLSPESHSALKDAVARFDAKPKKPDMELAQVQDAARRKNQLANIGQIVDEQAHRPSNFSDFVITRAGGHPTQAKADSGFWEGLRGQADQPVKDLLVKRGQELNAQQQARADADYQEQNDPNSATANGLRQVALKLGISPESIQGVSAKGITQMYPVLKDVAEQNKVELAEKGKSAKDTETGNQLLKGIPDQYSHELRALFGPNWVTKLDDYRDRGEKSVTSLRNDLEGQKGRDQGAENARTAANAAIQAGRESHAMTQEEKRQAQALPDGTLPRVPFNDTVYGDIDKQWKALGNVEARTKDVDEILTRASQDPKVAASILNGTGPDSANLRGALADLRTLNNEAGIGSARVGSDSEQHLLDALYGDPTHDYLGAVKQYFTGNDRFLQLKTALDSHVQSQKKVFRDNLKAHYDLADDSKKAAPQGAPSAPTAGKQIDHYLYSPDGKQRVEVFSDGSKGKPEQVK